MINEQGSFGAGLTKPFKRFAIGAKTGVTGIAPVQAIPDTAAQWAIINVANVDANAGNPAFSDTVFIEEIGAYLTSGTPGLGGSLWGCIFTAPITGSTDANVGIVNVMGGSKTSSVVVKSAVTISTPAHPFWFPLAETTQSIAAAAFSTGYANSMMHRDKQGRLAIPPGSALGLAVIAPAGTSPLYAPFAQWTEQQAAVS